jgi:hypothetical protein
MHLMKDLKRMWPKTQCTECGTKEPTTCAECTAKISLEAARQRAVAERMQREARSFDRAMARLDGPFARTPAERRRRRQGSERSEVSIDG